MNTFASGVFCFKSGNCFLLLMEQVIARMPEINARIGASNARRLFYARIEGGHCSYKAKPKSIHAN